MNVLFLGDIVGKAGRVCVSEQLPLMKAKFQSDFIIANGENAAHGKGITKRLYHELLRMGIDVITMGNHTFSKNDIFNFIEDADRLVRPANLSPRNIGKGTRIFSVASKTVAVTNLCGEIFMNNVVQSPFKEMESILEQVQADIHIVDLHGETTSEKIAFAYHFAGRVQAVLGTHTHVQTADERLVYGTAAISDVGMCGAYTSVLGRDMQEVVTRFTTDEKTRYTVAEGPGVFCAVHMEFDDATNRAVKIERIQVRPEHIEE